MTNRATIRTIKGQNEPVAAGYGRGDSRGAAIHVVWRRARAEAAEFHASRAPELGKILYDNFVEALKALGVRVETGVFQAHMSVELVNDGPVTILVDSEKNF